MGFLGKRRDVLGKYLVILLLLLGLFLRIWHLDKAPISLFGDEIDVGLQAKSILTTGKDYMGNNFPIMFRSFAEYRLPMQLYLSVPFVAFFGLSELGVRGASIVMGLVSILGMYVLAKELFGKRVAAISALVIAFSPWHFVLSRQANDAGFVLPFILFGTAFFLKGLSSYKYMVVAALLFGLGVYSYAIFSLFAPVFVIVLGGIFYKEIRKHSFSALMKVVTVGLVIVTPYVYQTFTGTTTKRISDISVLPAQEVEARVIEARQWSKSIWGKIFYNKLTVVGEELFANYTQSISANFLFSSGDTNLRHNIGRFGQLYHFEIVTVTFGLALLLIRTYLTKNGHEKKQVFLVLAWILLAPLPGVLTKDGGTHAPRLVLLLPPLVLLSSLALEKLLTLKTARFTTIIVCLFLLVGLFDVAKFMHKYFVVWPNESWRFWHYGFDQTLEFVKSVDNDYDRVYFNNTYEPMLPRFLFYYNYDMAKFQTEFEGDVHKEAIAPNFNGFKLSDKYYFGDLQKPIERLAEPQVLVVASGVKDVTNPAIFDNPDLHLLDVFISPYIDSIFYVYTKS